VRYRGRDRGGERERRREGERWGREISSENVCVCVCE
jgi:hypothetical protein